jgi:hypothetical protein
MFWLEGWQLDWMILASALVMVVLMLLAKGMMQGGGQGASSPGRKPAGTR